MKNRIISGRAGKLLLTVGCALLAAGGVARAQFGIGNLAIVRLGDGTQTLGNTGNSVFIDEYSTIGSLVSSL
jgi:hypothetical protein